MADRFVINHIRGLPLFAQLTQEQQRTVADAFEVRRYEPGNLVFAQGQPAQGLYLFASGAGVLVRQRRDGVTETVAELGAGDFINEPVLYRPSLEGATLRITQQAIVLFLARDSFARLLMRSPELRANIRVPQGYAQPLENVPPIAQQPTPNLAPVGQPPRPTPQTPAPPFAGNQSAPTATVGGQPDPVTGAAPLRTMMQPMFKGQRDDETVLHVFKRHWWAFGRHLWIPAAIALAMFIFAVILAANAPAIALVVAALSIIVPAAIAFYLYYEWQDDAIIVTDQRVLHMYNNALTFENLMSEIPLERILETQIEIPPGDPFARLFNYGSVLIKSAGASASLLMPIMPNPRAVQEAIFTERERIVRAAARAVEAQHRDAIRADIERAFGIQTPPPMPADALAQPAASFVRPAPRLEAKSWDRGLPFARTRWLSDNGAIMYRRHVSVWLEHIAAPAVLMFGALVLFVLSLVPTFPIAGLVGLLVSLIAFSIGAIAFFLADWDWRNDTLTLADDTVIITRKRPLWLQNEEDAIRLSQIDNVTSEVQGPLNTLLNRGTITMSLLGAPVEGAKRFTYVPDPQGIAVEISRRQAALKSQRQMNDDEAQRRAIAEYLAVYHQSVAAQQQQVSSPPPGLAFNPNDGQGGGSQPGVYFQPPPVQPPPVQPPSPQGGAPQYPVRPPHIPPPREGR